MPEYKNPTTLRHKDHLTIVTIGDSTAAADPSYGHLVSTSEGIMIPWPELLAKAYPKHKFHNRAVNGDSFEMMRDRFYRDAFSLDPDIVIIAGGANNCWDVEHETTGIAAIDMANQCMANGIYVVVAPYLGISQDWVNATDIVKGETEAHRRKVCENFNIMQDAIVEWSEAHDIPVINASDVIACASRFHAELLRSDHMHPNNKGYQAIAKIAIKRFQLIFHKFGII